MNRLEDSEKNQGNELWRKQQKDMLDWREFMKNNEKQQQDREKEEYRKLCDDENANRRDKEKALAAYFRQKNDDMNQNLKAHIHHVALPRG